jgi:hypothetical protein
MPSRIHGGLGEIVRVDMQFDLDAIRKVPARLVEQHVPTGDQEKAIATGEEKTTGIGQRALLVEGADP